MAPLARLPTVPLQHAIWSRVQHATCKSTQFNKALARALQRANFISWSTESGAHPPDASLLKQFSPDELINMHVAYTANRHKRQLWMGLKYHTQEWKRENGWWESKQVPIMKTILSKSRKAKAARLVWSVDEVRRCVEGEDLGHDLWRKGLKGGQAVFLEIGGGKEVVDHDNTWSTPQTRRVVEILESREAVERGVGGLVVCRVWPFRPRVLKDDENADGDSTGEGELERAAMAEASAEGVKEER
ncbi:hypothetical protein AB5N19_06260 [Seiridium cardinale]